MGFTKSFILLLPRYAALRYQHNVFDQPSQYSDHFDQKSLSDLHR